MSYRNRKEIWKPTKYKDYIVSNTGQVTSLKYYNKDKRYQRTLSQTDDKDGYKLVTLYPNKTYVKAKVHRLVAEAFCKGKTEEKNMALHKDGNKIFNHAKNLYWGDSKDNKADSIRHGTNKADWTSMSSPSRILQPRNVKKIRRLISEGKLKLSEIAKMYGVHYKTIYDIKVGKSWKSVS
jgi:hypothetical protein